MTDEHDDCWAHNGDIRLWWQRFPGREGATRLLLINGLGSPAVSYQQGFVDRFVAAGFEVIRFDNRNLGRSSRSMDKYDASDPAVRDARAVFDAAGWDRAVVLVMHGSADTLIDVSAGRHTAACLANAEFIEIDGLGHDLQPGMWDRLVAEVARFVGVV